MRVALYPEPGQQHDLLGGVLAEVVPLVEANRDHASF